MAKAAPGPPPSPLSQPHSPFSPVGHQATLTYLEKGRGPWSVELCSSSCRAASLRNASDFFFHLDFKPV